MIHTYPRKDIKKHIENYIGLQNIAIRNKTEPLPKSRHVYFELCREYNSNKDSLQVMGNELEGRCHATVLNSYKKFSELYEKDIVLTDMYNKVKSLIKKDLEEREEPDTSGLFGGVDSCKENEIRFFYRTQRLLYLKKYNSVLRRLNSHNLKLQEKFKAIDSDLFEEISKLDETELSDLKDRINVFIKVRNKLKQI